MLGNSKRHPSTPGRYVTKPMRLLKGNVNMLNQLALSMVTLNEGSSRLKLSRTKISMICVGEGSLWAPSKPLGNSDRKERHT
jgi:hypothetical protein